MPVGTPELAEASKAPAPAKNETIPEDPDEPPATEEERTQMRFCSMTLK